MEEEKQKNAEKGMPIPNLTVSGVIPRDTWKNVVLTHFLNVTTLIENLTGKVINAVAKPSFCQSCIYWKNKDKNAEEYALWLNEQ